jgi:hypothetical protein
MKTTCVYCGKNPVPHWFYRYSESLNILLTWPRQKFLYNPLTGFFAKREWSSFLEKLFLDLGMFLGVIKLRGDVSLCKIRRAQVLWEEAEKRGIKMRELIIFGRAVDTYVAEKIRNPQSAIVFNGLPRPAGYVNKWLDLMDDKWLFKKIMMENNLPVPMGASCSNFRQARKIFNEIQNISPNLKSVIVKPRAGSRGRHSTTFVRSEADLKKAFKIAKKLCYWVMVEEQLFGPVYRATIIDGHLAGVLRGDPPQVLGDGVHSIADLIGIKNSLPHQGVKDIVINDEMKRFTKRQLNQPGFGAKGHPRLKDYLKTEDAPWSLDEYIPLSDEIITLSEKIGVNYGGSSSEDYDICHPDNKELFITAAKVLGDPIVGFDFIIPNITVSWKNQKCGLIEVNSLPFINLHHDPLLGTPRNAAALVWNMLGW